MAFKSYSYNENDDEGEYFKQAGKGTTLTNYRQITKTGDTRYEPSNW